MAEEKYLDPKDQCNNDSDLMGDELDFKNGVQVILSIAPENRIASKSSQDISKTNYVAYCYAPRELLRSFDNNKSFYYNVISSRRSEDITIYKEPYMGVWIDEDGVENSKLFNTLVLEEAKTVKREGRHDITLYTLIPIKFQKFKNREKITRNDLRNVAFTEEDYLPEDVSRRMFEINTALVSICKGIGGCNKISELEKARNLISRGADVNFRNEDGWTTLMYACGNKTPVAVEIVKLLLEKGADVNIVDADGWSALMVACSNKGTEIVKLLLEKEANINLRDEDGQTALIIACIEIKSESDFELVKSLLDWGADINSRDESGETALMYACKTVNIYSIKTIKLLIQRGADESGVTSRLGLAILSKAKREL
jgi:ankyrin repeat protein